MGIRVIDREQRVGAVAAARRGVGTPVHAGSEEPAAEPSVERLLIGLQHEGRAGRERGKSGESAAHSAG